MSVLISGKQIHLTNNIQRVNKPCNAVTPEQMNIKLLLSYTLYFSRQQPIPLLCSQDTSFTTCNSTHGVRCTKHGTEGIMLQNTYQNKIYMQVIPSIYNRVLNQRLFRRHLLHTNATHVEKKAERQSEKGTVLVMAKELWLQNCDIIISKSQLKCGTFEKSVFELNSYTDH